MLLLNEFAEISGALIDCLWKKNKAEKKHMDVVHFMQLSTMVIARKHLQIHKNPIKKWNECEHLCFLKVPYCRKFDVHLFFLL